MSFELTILGSSSGLPTSKRFSTAHALNVNERFFLIDCGEGTQIQCRKYNIRLGKINHIFISHLHGDHVFGLLGLMSTFNLLDRKHDLNIYAHRDIIHTIEYFEKNFTNKLSYNIITHHLKSKGVNQIYEDNQVVVHSFPLRHRIPTCGFVFREKEKPRNIKKELIEKYNISVKDIRSIKEGSDLILENGQIIPNRVLTLPPYKTRSYAYCSDTKYFKKLVSFVQDTDLLYHEATFTNAEKTLAKETFHSTSEEAALTARDAGAKTLLLGHFSARYKDTGQIVKEAKTIFKNVIAVNDGDKFSVQPERIKNEK